jgi:outer membrane lipoprotein SlyB
MPVTISFSLDNSGLRACLRMLVLVAATAVGACASPEKRPVLYPNAHLKRVGDQVARQETDACLEMARNSAVNETVDGEVGRKAASGAAVGAAAAGAWGLVRGDAVSHALAGAAAGASAGAVSGGLQSTETSPVFINFVNKCLSDKGYSVIGWE